MQTRNTETTRATATMIVPPGESGELANDAVTDATARDERRRKGQQAYEANIQLREEILAASGVQPDSTPLIRALRDGDGRSDAN